MYVTENDIAEQIILDQKLAESLRDFPILYAKLSKGFKDKPKNKRLGKMK